MSDDPIIPDIGCQPFSAEVIDLDGIRIQWGRPVSRASERCEHKSTTYSREERRVWCNDCKRTIENFDVVMMFVRYFEGMERAARLRLAKAEEAVKSAVRRIATKNIDKAWSGNVMAIACPHCRRGLLPEDFERITSVTSREIEIARRGKGRT